MVCELCLNKAVKKMAIAHMPHAEQSRAERGQEGRFSALPGLGQCRGSASSPFPLQLLTLGDVKGREGQQEGGAGGGGLPSPWSRPRT